MSNKAEKIVFKGRVQGVGFRFTAHRIAKRYELTGFVRNLPDGTVEMLAQGHPEDIKDCLRDISESFANNIRETRRNDANFDSSYEDFLITR